MAGPGDPNIGAFAISAKPPRHCCGQLSALEVQLHSADEDFEHGDYIELTAEQLEHCVMTGDSPWHGEFHG